MPPSAPDTPTKHYNIGTSWPIYFEDEPGRRSTAKLLSRDEARRIAVNIAKLRPTALRQWAIHC
jgi:hypothetical protein